MKIMIVMPVAEQRGGAEICLTNLLMARPCPAEWVVVFLHAGPMVEQSRVLGASVHVVEAGRLRELHRIAATAVQIAKIARQEKVEVLVGWMATGQCYSGPAALLAGVPGLWFQHGIPPSLLDRIATLLPSKGILTCSKTVAAAQASLWPTRPMTTVYPPVALERFDPKAMAPVPELRRKLGLPEASPIVGIVGRLQRWKGIHVLIESMPAILRVYPDTLCAVVGGVHDLEPDYKEYLRQKIHALGLKEQVRLVGLQRNIPEWMQAMNVVVHASDHEPFGMVVIEAMALGKPVIAGAQGGPTEIITPGLNGQLVEYGDAAGLAAAVLRYMQDASFAQKMGQAATYRAADFSSDCYTQSFIEAIRSLTANLASSIDPVIR